jgi:hypothetical protein
VTASLQKIVSGGQTGADRAGLDWAIFHDIPHGGWCPKSRKAEDGVIPAHYGLAESTSSSYLQRTEWNVRDSDATAIFTIAANLTGGSKRTAEFAKKLGKPWIHIHQQGTYEKLSERLAHFVNEHGVRILNVAGSRGSKEPPIHSFVKLVLEETFFPRPESLILNETVRA